MKFKSTVDYSDVCAFYNGGECKVPILTTAEEKENTPLIAKHDMVEFEMSSYKPEDMLEAFSEVEKKVINYETMDLSDMI